MYINHLRFIFVIIYRYRHIKSIKQSKDNFFIIQQNLNYDYLHSIKIDTI